MIYLRPATMEDSANLLAWRNDPTTCANSRSTKPVPARRHAFWMDVNVKFGYPQRVVLIAENGKSEPIGVIDFCAADPAMKTYEVGITVAPRMRGQGIGEMILALGVKRMKDRALTAEIRKENATSRKIFTRCGFALVRDDKEFGYYRKEPA